MTQRLYPGATIVCCATGPSITADQVQVARDRGWILYACNDAFRLVPDCALLHACNWQWWDARWEEVKNLACEKWTTRREAADKYGINWIDEKPNYGQGLSPSRDYLHHGHGSGYQLVGMAHRAQARRIILLGYDLKFAPDYDGRSQQVGSRPRHFFGEYEAALQHWPHMKVRDGVHFGMQQIYRDTAEQMHVTGPEAIINCSPDSALDAFPRMDIRDVE